ncbi:MAG TPA: M24 family metallopeptidase, partial [Firmicutes bacterium]|nr:M24 family metallopeptidase [Bacillota bacterium]
FGRLPSLLARAFEAALEVQETVKQLLLPGITGGEIYAAAAAVAQKLGFAGHFMGVGRTQAPYVGHGVGLEFDELPVLGKNSPHQLTVDTVVAVEPKFIFPGLGMVGLENTWHITASGPVKLSLTADEHVIL